MRIVKRKRGRETYFYLQHSMRRDNKVVTREVYLGKEIPKNLTKYKDVLEKETIRNTIEKLEKIKDNFQKDWKKPPQKRKRSRT
jgi:hypothetical protein